MTRPLQSSVLTRFCSLRIRLEPAPSCAIYQPKQNRLKALLISWPSPPHKWTCGCTVWPRSMAYKVKSLVVAQARLSAFHVPRAPKNVPPALPRAFHPCHQPLARAEIIFVYPSQWQLLPWHQILTKVDAPQLTQLWPLAIVAQQWYHTSIPYIIKSSLIILWACDRESIV